MLPAEVLHRPDLPLLGTGKTDYPERAEDRDGVSGGGVRVPRTVPRTPFYRRLQLGPDDVSSAGPVGNGGITPSC